MSVSLIILDDNAATGVAMEGVVRSLGFDSLRVPTLERALAAHGSDGFDVMLVHVENGAVSLEELARALDEYPPSARPGVLLYAREADAVRAHLGHEAFDYLLPPFDPALIRVRLDALLEYKRAVERQEDSARHDEILKLERDLQIGREIQQGFLPAVLPQPEGWEITTCFHPAREVAGDFYDAFYMVNKRRVGFVIADVCDKGVGAALFMALIRTLVRSNAQHTTSLSWMDPMSGSITENKDWLRGSPGQRRQSLPNIGTGALMNAVAGTNDYITENHMAQGYFATMFFGVLDPTNGSLIYINGGHNPPMLVRTDGSHELLKPTGPAVGMLPGVRFQMSHTRLGPGDLLFTYTDGVTDARSPAGEFFSEKRLFDVVGRGAPSAEAMVGDIEARLHAHIGTASQFDDITMLAVRRQPDGTD